MPIKFSELTQKNISDSSYIAGLYIDTTSETNQANCKIPTSQFAKQSDLESSYVNITGNQAISGEKSFTNSITKQSLVIDSATYPSSNQYNQINFKDKNGVRMGSVENAIYTDGTFATILNCVRTVAGNTIYSQVAAGIDKYGTPWATAPTPDANDNSSRIATTAWARSYLSTFLSLLYPYGSLYIGTQSTCPLATLIPGSTWTLVGQGKALWGGNGTNGDHHISAGLPDHTHSITLNTKHGKNGNATTVPYFSDGDVGYALTPTATTTYASASNSIYGRSSTVQPPAYIANIWRRQG